MTAPGIFYYDIFTNLLLKAHLELASTKANSPQAQRQNDVIAVIILSSRSSANVVCAL